LKEKHGVMMIGNTPDSTCPMCATKHDPTLPHNLKSLAYQYKFYDENGRWPTWDDAMAHCTDEVKAMWMEALSDVLAKNGGDDE
jgi:hypothetical protein